MAVEVIRPREVPLGGLRAMTVRQTLPARGRTTIGAWCFVDHYGPDEVAATGGMVVAPHPHTGLQTVSWLFEGEIEHRDSAGHHALVRPGELNLMTAGPGISHSEVSTPGTARLHGAQLWVALPAASTSAAPAFEHHEPPVLDRGPLRARVLLGELLGHRSPVTTYSPLLGAELVLAPGADIDLEVDPAFEHGVLVDTGTVTVGETEAVAADLVHVEEGSGTLRLRAGEGARVLLLGGPPFEEELVMWWNFVGRSDAEVREARAQWQALLAGEESSFALPAEDPLEPIPAPDVPRLTLVPRGNRR